MAEIITAKGTGFFIEKVIRGARERIVLISPYLKVQKLYLDELKIAAKRKVSIAIVFREDEAKADQLEALWEIEGVELSCLPELHAKCYFNEHRFVLTSMNLYDHSELHNKELGIMLEEKTDQDLFKDAVSHAVTILGSSKPLLGHRKRKPTPSVTADVIAPYSAKRKEKKQGHCVRCKTELRYNPDYPFCVDCYTSWAKWSNDDFPEKYCHRCGKEKDTITRVKPQCRECYHAWQAEVKAVY